MAKKRTLKKPAANQNASRRSPRKEPYNSQRVSTIVERLREQAARLNQLAKAMEDAGVADVVVDGHAMLVRGLNQIDNFSDNASRAVREAKSALVSL